MNNDTLVGTWRLLSCKSKKESGEIDYPFGESPIGYLLYNHDSYMSVCIMSGDRPKFSEEDMKGGFSEEKVSAFETYLSYSGKYEANEAKVIHHVEISLFPNWVGTQQERFYRFEDDKLYLSAAPTLIRKETQTAYLIWERVY